MVEQVHGSVDDWVIISFSRGSIGGRVGQASMRDAPLASPLRHETTRESSRSDDDEKDISLCQWLLGKT